jgi:hypothetical protein
MPTPEHKVQTEGQAGLAWFAVRDGNSIRGQQNFLDRDCEPAGRNPGGVTVTCPNGRGRQHERSLRLTISRT